MPNEMKRIQVNGGVTEVLIKALEEAGDTEHILILFQKKPEAGGGAGFFHGGEAEVQTLNFMVDRFKQWIFKDHDEDEL